MNELTKITKPTPSGQQSQGLIPSNLHDAMQLAEMMARGKMMPDHLKTPGDALMVIEQAMRWNMSPFAVAQSTFNIKGKLLFAGTIVAAAIENSGAIQGLMDYQFSGEGQSRKITVTATRRGESEPRVVEVALKDAITANDIWKKQPDQQLVYHGSRVWARRWTPGVMLGVYTPEEWRDLQPEVHNGPMLDAQAEVYAAPAPQIEQPMVAKRTWRTLIDETSGMLTACDDMDAVVAVGDLPAVRKALEIGPPHVQAEIKALLADAYERVQAYEPAEEPVPEQAPPVPAEASDFPGDRP